MASPGRDDNDHLICQIRTRSLRVGGIGKLCGAKIRAFTGLQEIEKLGKHIKRTHRLYFDMNALLELRANWEQPPIAGDADTVAERAFRKRDEDDHADPAAAAEAYQAEMEARLRAWRERDL